METINYYNKYSDSGNKYAGCSLKMPSKCGFMNIYRTLITFLLLSFGLIACAQPQIDTAKPSPPVSSDLNVTLTAIAKLANLDSPSIDVKALAALAQTDLEQIIKGGAWKSNSVTFKYILPTTLNSGITAIYYSRKPTSNIRGGSTMYPSKMPKSNANYVERVAITFNPTILCVIDKGVREAWSQQFKEAQFAPLFYGPGDIHPGHGIHQDREEQKRRGGGPIEMVVNVLEPKGILHESNFKFDFLYWICPAGVVLERKYQ